jgi:hypothetical protein
MHTDSATSDNAPVSTIPGDPGMFLAFLLVKRIRWQKHGREVA